MIGLVVVSHSRALAEAAVGLAERMVPEPRPAMAVAAGLDDGSFGTDAAAIALAIRSVDSPDGVLVLLDLGSALLSSELAVEFLDEPVARHVRITPAPLVEGLLSAVVSAATGADLARVEAEARDALSAKAAHLDGDGQGVELLQVPRQVPLPAPSSRPLMWRTTVRNPHGIHVRPAAAIVAELRGVDADVLLSNATTGRGPASADSLSRIAALEIRQGQILEARFSGPEADRAKSLLADLASRDFAEHLDRARRRPAAPPRPERVVASEPAPPAAERRTVVGKISRSALRPSTTGYHPRAPKDELVRFNAAAVDVADFLADTAATSTGIPGILEAQQTMLEDRELHHGVVSSITKGFSAIEAVDRHLTKMARTYDEFTDPYLRERGQDVRSLRRLLQLALLDRPLAEQSPDQPRILLVEELDAATATRLDNRTCLGVITQFGGASSHGMLAAQARGIPVLAGHPRAPHLPDGGEVAFDPVTGELWTDEIDDELRAELERRNAERDAAASQAQSRAFEPAVTGGGRRIIVTANLGSLSDATTAAGEGAEGAGVVRSELLFASASTAPSARAQADVLVQLGRVLTGPLAVRTWDPAGDKPLAFLPHAHEDNPALGVRGIRALRQRPDILAEQLRAIAIASREVRLKILLPMVTDPAEVQWARGIWTQVREEESASGVPFGMMIEVPAAALRAADFAGLVDFVSLGTNDLSQYTQAADRGNAAVSELARQDAPAVLDLIGMTCRALPQLPVSVCGDLASDPAVTAELIRLGVGELSVRPQMVAEVKQAVRQA